MPTLSLPLIFLRNPFHSLFGTKAPEPRSAPESRSTQRHRREFIDEMLTRSPDSFSSAYDIEAAMLLCPDRF